MHDVEGMEIMHGVGNVVHHTTGISLGVVSRVRYRLKQVAALYTAVTAYKKVISTFVTSRLSNIVVSMRFE